jgi:PhoH-like ATPase
LSTKTTQTIKKQKSVKKTFVLDTNILLSDPEALRSFQDNDVVLPLIVVEELDRFKDKQDDVGKNAREISRQLIDYVRQNKNDVKKGIPLGKGMGKLKVLSQKDLENNVIIVIPELDQSKGDNKIVQFCLEYKQKFSDEKLVLVTRDLLLRIKAISVGIDCEDYRKLSKELVQSMNMPATEEEFYTGVQTFQITKEDMDEIYAQQDDKVILSEAEEKGLYPNQFVVFECPETGVKWAGRFIEPGKPLKKVAFQKNVWNIKSKNMEQAFLLDLLMDDSIKLVTVNSRSGAGKTLITMAAALELVIEKKKYNKVIITRNVQSMGKDIGFLPGDLNEKLAPWIAPFKDNLEFLLNENVDAAMTKGASKKKGENVKQSFMMQDLFDRGIVQAEATSFIRGRSIPNCFFILDETQNTNLHEIKTILTRVGEGTKIILLGDVNQIDNTYVNKFTNGLTIAIEKFKGEAIAGHVMLTKGERSELASKSAEIL